MLLIVLSPNCQVPYYMFHKQKIFGVNVTQQSSTSLGTQSFLFAMCL
jgi:hypothetical protein